MNRQDKDIIAYPVKNIVYLTLGSLFALIAGAFLFFSFSGYTNESFVGNAILESTKHEELHRYLGYETLLPRYLTMPYDSSIGVNQFGHFLDIGYIFLIFIPIIIFYIIRRSKMYTGIFALVFISYMIISLGNSLSVDSLTLNRLDTVKKLNNFLDANPESFIDEQSSNIVLTISKFYNFNLKSFFETISGDRDIITYIFLFILFLGLGLIGYLYSLRRGAAIGMLTLFATTYCFFWITLSSGVIWYGYILFFFLMILMKYASRQLKFNEANVPSKFIRYSFLTFLSIWIAIGFTCRVSNVNLTESFKNMGKSMFHSSVVKYNLGLLHGEDEVIEDMDKGQSLIFNRMNENREHLVYKVGTSLMCFIKENHRRVFNDDQLNKFRQLKEEYKSNKVIIDVLKASNIKFILLDLQTFSIDKTPEQSLAKKFDSFREFVARNPDLKFLGTDRVIKFKDKEGKDSFTRHIYGDPVYLGTYAAFEIL